VGEAEEWPDKFTELVGVSLPFAVSVLRDGDGVIDLKVPVTGDVARPEFDFGDAIRTALRNAVVDVVAAPFRLVGQIVQAAGYVAIRIEMIHETRIIPLDRRPHVGKAIALDIGDPRGRWDGNTLVVETTNFRDRSVFRNANPETLRLVERFTRVSPDTVEWSVTVDDPTTWTRPWTFMIPLTRNDKEPVYEYACHEGNYAMRNLLSVSRAAEAAAK